MPAADYGLGQLSMSSVRIPTTTKNEEIRFVCWGGRFRINVTKTGDLKPIFEFICNGEKGLAVRRVMERILKASPGTRYPIIFSAWDNNERKFKPSHALTFVKDDKNVYRVELKYKGVTYEAVVKGPSGISFGSDAMSEAEKSSFGMEYILDYVANTVRIQEILTNKKMERTGSAPSAPSAQSSTPGSDEDFF